MKSLPSISLVVRYIPGEYYSRSRTSVVGKENTARAASVYFETSILYLL